MADKTWRCFHCDEVFTCASEAKVHFGTTEFDLPACQLTNDQKGLVELLRAAWELNRELQKDEGADYIAFHSLGAKHSTELREAEQAGYDRGLADGRALAGGKP